MPGSGEPRAAATATDTIASGTVACQGHGRRPRGYFAKPILTAVFLTVNGLVLFVGERLRRRQVHLDERQTAEDLEMVTVGGKADIAPGTLPTSGR